MSIVCGTDLSAASSGALEVAVALAAQRGDREVVLVHVVDPELGSSATSRDQVLQQTRVALESLAATSHRVAVRVEVVVGPPAETLVSLAETQHADLIVIAARSTSSSLLRIGSTSAQVIARTHVA